jgi:dTDP-4-amino-4,6-dideoxygalactose transaminase
MDESIPAQVLATPVAIPQPTSGPVRDEMLVFGAPSLGEEEIQEVVDTLRSGWIGTGPRVAKFEREFSAYKSTPAAVALGSCTAALQLSMRAANIGAGDEVITTPLTFCATVNAILHSGAKPILADIDPVTMNIDPEQIRARITDRTKAILPVHMAGRSCDMDAIMAIAREFDLIVIEDCAHAIETTYKGKPAGTFGMFGCFSFYVTKNVITGEGGMVITRFPEAAERIKVLALHGMSNDAWNRFGDEGYKHYFVVEPGFKTNMMDIQAALGIHQLRRVESNWERRLQIWDRYDEALRPLPLTLPAPEEEGNRHACHLYTIMVDEERTGISRDAFLAAMTWHNIGVGVHYLSLPEHPYYSDALGWRAEDYPNAARVGRQTVSLPLSPGMTNCEVQDVIDAVHEILSR